MDKWGLQTQTLTCSRCVSISSWLGKERVSGSLLSIWRRKDLSPFRLEALDDLHRWAVVWPMTVFVGSLQATDRSLYEPEDLECYIILKFFHQTSNDLKKKNWMWWMWSDVASLQSEIRKILSLNGCTNILYIHKCLSDKLCDITLVLNRVNPSAWS